MVGQGVAASKEQEIDLKLQITDQLSEMAEYKDYGIDEKLCFWEAKDKKLIDSRFKAQTNQQAKDRQTTKKKLAIIKVSSAIHLCNPTPLALFASVFCLGFLLFIFFVSMLILCIFIFFVSMLILIIFIFFVSMLPGTVHPLLTHSERLRSKPEAPGGLQEET
eukprot:SAG31_NODE_1273_length_9057_cov_13.364103_8_plen_163_part_00